MAAKKAPKVEEVKDETPAPVRVQVLTVEAHPTLGRLTRWQLSDGSIEEVWE